MEESSERISCCGCISYIDKSDLPCFCVFCNIYYNDMEKPCVVTDNGCVYPITELQEMLNNGWDITKTVEVHTNEIVAVEEEVENNTKKEIHDINKEETDDQWSFTLSREELQEAVIEAFSEADREKERRKAYYLNLFNNYKH